MSRIKQQIEYLNKKLAQHSNIAICCDLSKKELKELSKHFNIQRQPFGYKEFTKKEG